MPRRQRAAGHQLPHVFQIRDVLRMTSLRRKSHLWRTKGTLCMNVSYRGLTLAALARADTALYAAKHSGRNRVKSFAAVEREGGKLSA